MSKQDRSPEELLSEMADMLSDEPLTQEQERRLKEGFARLDREAEGKTEEQLVEEIKALGEQRRRSSPAQ